MKKYTLFLSLLTLAFNLGFAQKADTTKLNLANNQKFTSKNSVTINGESINYTATVGRILLKNDKEEVVAAMGYTAYIKEGESDMSKRPIMFAYNGGPGSPSFWLHIGILGPKRILLNDPNPNGGAPYKFVQNQYSVLDQCDLVMIDPIGTGISRTVGNGKYADFFGVVQDTKSVSQAIHNFIKENNRFNSPKILLGESYGTMRNAAVVNYLQSNYGISMNKVVMVSNVLDLRTLAFLPGDELSYILYLPSYAVTSWYHNLLPNKNPNLESFLEEVRKFSFNEYTLALMKGDNISKEEKAKCIEKLVAYTGISKEYWEKANLRVNSPQYMQEILRDKRVSVGRLDSRYKAIMQNKNSEFPGDDAMASDIGPAVMSTFMDYYFGELKVSKELNYNLSARILPDYKWDWKHPASYGFFGDVATPNTAVELKNAMSNNPTLKVLVMNGYYDMATPFVGTEYTYTHMGLDEKIQKNIIQTYYEAGHMMYINEDCAKKFKTDLVEFLK